MRVSLQEARRQGEIAAARELIRLDVDQTKPINIFRIIQKEQLWLRFEQFDSPFEAPHGTFYPGGILINSDWSLRVQRLTAAHEYGHHVLGHAPSIDDQGNLGDPKKIEQTQEAAAQAFATDFMMPVKLVNSQWKKLGFPNTIEPWQAYQLALHLGTSYQATVYQLLAQGRLTISQGQRLLKVEPAKLKSYVGGGRGPAQTRADIWLLDHTQSDSHITVSVDDEIRIQLPESPATGYLWSLPIEGVRDERHGTESTIEQDDDSIFSLVRSEFDAIDRRLVLEGAGGEGNRYITLRAIQPGKLKLHLQLRRPWSKRSTPLEEYTLSLRVSQRVKGFQSEIKKAMLA